METIEEDLSGAGRKSLDLGILTDFQTSPILDEDVIIRIVNILKINDLTNSKNDIGLNRWVLRRDYQISGDFELVISQFMGRDVNEWGYSVTCGKRSFGTRVVPTYELHGISRIEVDPKFQSYVRFIQEDDMHIAKLVVNRWGGVAILSSLKRDSVSY